MAINNYLLTATVTVTPVFESGTTATGTITAGAGSAALPAGVAATGFALSFSAAPSTTGTATLSNVVGGSQVYDIPSGQTSPFEVTFPEPIAASGGAITLTVAALGTGTGVIELYGEGATPGEPGTGGGAGYGSAGVVSGEAPWPTTFLKGQLIALDPAGQLYALIGGGNLRQVTPAQETGGLGIGTSN
jgi:hypothetical protein